MNRSILLFSLFCAVMVIAGGVAVAQKSGDAAARVAWEKYRKVSTSGLSGEERIAKYKEWRKTFEDMLAQDLSDDIRHTLLTQTLALNNALGDTEQSFKKIDELLQEKEISVEERIRWITESGEVANSAFIRSHRQDKEIGLKGVEAFEKANKLIDQQGANQQLLEQKILNLAWAGSILGRFKESKEHLSTARTYYQQAIAARQSFDEPVGRLKGTNYGMEQFLLHEAQLSAYLDDMDGLKKSLNLLDKVPNKRNYQGVMSSIVDDIAKSAFLAKGEGEKLRAFLIWWVSNNQDDTRTCILVAEIVESFMRDQPEGYLDDVLPYLLSVIDGKYADPLKTIESDQMKQGIGGGQYANALSELIRVYKARKDYANAEKYNALYIELFPNDKINTPIAKRDAITIGDQKLIQEIENGKKQFSVLGLTLRITPAIVFLALGLLFFYLGYRKKK